MYYSDVKPVLRSFCEGCHKAGGRLAALDTLIQVNALAARIESKVQGGTMPPKAAAQMGAAEKAKLLQWLREGADRR